MASPRYWIILIYVVFSSMCGASACLQPYEAQSHFRNEQDKKCLSDSHVNNYVTNCGPFGSSASLQGPNWQGWHSELWPTWSWDHLVLQQMVQEDVTNHGDSIWTTGIKSHKILQEHLVNLIWTSCLGDCANIDNIS